MAGKINPSRTGCVVALVKKAPDPFFTRVGSGYEAAAELLSGPVSALLVDLGMLQAEHASLLKLAAGLDVPVVAFGAVSAALDGEALAGVRLVGAEEVPETLREIVAGEAMAKPLSGKFVAEVKKAPDPFSTVDEKTRSSITEKEPIKVSVPLIDKPLTRDELDALLRD